MQTYHGDDNNPRIMLPDRGGMRLPPPSVVASWPKPNYADPVTRGNALFIVNIVFQTLATIAVAGRLYSRYVKKWFGLDDALIILAYILDVALTTVIMLAKERYGWDRHEWDLPPTMITPANKIAFAAKMLFAPTTTLIRLSLICFYYRLVRDSGVRWFRYTLHVSTVYTILVCFVFLMLAVLECIPIQAYWVYPPIGGHCLDEGRVLLGAGILNSVSDLLTTILPIPIVMRLKMPLRHRIGVCILLSMGVIVTIAGIIRIYYTWESLIASWDESWRAYPLWIATAVEIHLGMICACVPAWKSLLHEPFRKLFAKLSSSSYLSGSAPNPRSTAKKTFLNPLKSLPWFQHTRFDFERTQRDPVEYDRGHLETSKYLPIMGEGKGAGDGRHYEVAGDSATITTRPSNITVRKSIDMSSIHLEGPPIAPPHWIWYGSHGRSPRKDVIGSQDVV